jgi:hypothetical protein
MFNLITTIAKLLPSAWNGPGVARLKSLAPYALIELLLPGGSIIALTLWMLRRRKRMMPLASP